MTIIPERDVYRLVMRSKLPAAEAFEEWVVAEVLPSIRKTCSYGLQAIDWNDPVPLANFVNQSCQQLLTQSKIIEQQTYKIEQDQPKVSSFEQYADREGLYTLQNAGCLLTGRPNKFIQSLKGEYLFYQGTTLVAKAQYVSRGLFEVKATMVDDKARMQTCLTSKGVQYFAEKLGANLAIF